MVVSQEELMDPGTSSGGFDLKPESA
ncbi:hypothetical protein CCP4SC76_390018 [Gammaproteobacteria bacterium]